LGSFFSYKNGGDVRGGGGDSGWTASTGETHATGNLESAKGDGFNFASEAELVAEAADVVARGAGGNECFKFFNHEAVAATDFFFVDGGDVSDFVKGAGDSALSA